MPRSEHRLLWQINTPTFERPSYLFGTMHVRDNRAFAGLKQVLDYLHQCDAFAAEIDFAEVDPARLAQAARLPRGRHLRDCLSPSVYAKLNALVQQELGQPLFLFDQLAPVMLVNQLSEAQLEEEQHQPLDQVLYHEAQIVGKQLLGLESFEEQLAVFDQLDWRTQCRSLKHIATHFKRFKRGLRQTTAAYIKGDITQLLHKTQRSIGNMRRPLLYDRNRRMATRFMQYSAHQALFGAVGAAHLAGEQGMLRLLKQQGCRLRPIAYLVH